MHLALALKGDSRWGYVFLSSPYAWANKLKAGETTAFGTRIELDTSPEPAGLPAPWFRDGLAPVERGAAAAPTPTAAAPSASPRTRRHAVPGVQPVEPPAEAPSVGMLQQPYVSQLSLVDARALLEQRRMDYELASHIPVPSRAAYVSYWTTAIACFDRVYPPAPDGSGPTIPAPGVADTAAYNTLVSAFSTAGNSHAYVRDPYAVYAEMLHKLGWMSRVAFVANLSALERYVVVRVAHERERLGLPLHAGGVADLDPTFAKDDLAVENEADKLFGGLGLLGLVRERDTPLEPAPKATTSNGRVQYIGCVTRAARLI